MPGEFLIFEIHYNMTANNTRKAMYIHVRRIRRALRMNDYTQIIYLRANNNINLLSIHLLKTIILTPYFLFRLIWLTDVLNAILLRSLQSAFGVFSIVNVI